MEDCHQWLKLLPQSRNAEIIMQTILFSPNEFLSQPNADEAIVDLIISGQEYAESCSSLLNLFPSSSNIWEKLMEAIENGYLCSVTLITFIYKAKNWFLQKHLLKSFVQSLESIQKTSSVNLQHQCQPGVIWVNKYISIILSSNEDCFQYFYKILYKIIQESNYRLHFVKTATNLLADVFKLSSDAIHFCPSDLQALIFLLRIVPCTICCDLIFSSDDIEYIKNEIITRIANLTPRIALDLKMLLCLHSYWIPKLIDHGLIRVLFLS